MQFLKKQQLLLKEPSFLYLGVNDEKTWSVRNVIRTLIRLSEQVESSFKTLHTGLLLTTIERSQTKQLMHLHI